jgi:hypothetical protein
MEDSPVVTLNTDAGSLASLKQGTDLRGCRHRSWLWSSRRYGESHRGEKSEDGDELHGGCWLGSIVRDTGDHLVLGTGFWYDLRRLTCRQDRRRTLANDSWLSVASACA